MLMAHEERGVAQDTMYVSPEGDPGTLHTLEECWMYGITRDGFQGRTFVRYLCEVVEISCDTPLSHVDARFISNLSIGATSRC